MPKYSWFYNKQNDNCKYTTKQQYKNAVLISLHSNAGGGTGFEIWTSEGQTRSDGFAEIMGQTFIDSFLGSPFRPDKSDGDLDKESQFYILKYIVV